MMPTENKTDAAMVLGLLLAIGLLGGGYFIGQAVQQARSMDRFVTVKGLAEREVRANLCIWPIGFKTTGNALPEIYAGIGSDKQAINDFLTGKGFDDAEIFSSPPRLTDYHAQALYGNQRPPNRYSAESTVTLRTAQVEKARAVMQASGELIKAGVVLQTNYQPEYLFTDLNAIKPEMIATATKNARKAAEQFAVDSGSRVGAIRKATQGLFSITNRDAYSREYKKIRVVTTVEYFLVDD